MAKTRIPKKIVGFKVPRMVRRNAVLSALLASSAGRKILAEALMAGAAAAAAVLTASGAEDVANAGTKIASRSRTSGNLAVKAAKDAAVAMVGVVTDAANSVLPAREPKRRTAKSKTAKIKAGARKPVKTAKRRSEKNGAGRAVQSRKIQG
jgi:hypothetical protein